MTAVELVKHNLGRLKQKCSLVKAYQGNALKLKRFEPESFDLVLLFGPMYHLKGEGEKLQALLEAKRVLRSDGVLLVAYIMNEFDSIDIDNELDYEFACLCMRKRLLGEKL